MALDLIQVENRNLPDQIIRLVDPDSGEVVLLADAAPELIASVAGRVKLRLDENNELLRDAMRILSDEIIERMDDNAEWTVRSRGVKVSAPSPAAKRYSWDADALREILDGLIAGKVITRAAALRACEQRIENVAVVAGINKLLKVPKARDAILMARREAEPPKRTVQVKVDAGEI